VEVTDPAGMKTYGAEEAVPVSLFESSLIVRDIFAI